MATSTYGVLPTGYKPAQLNDITTELRASFQSSFGNVTLSSSSVIGQLIGIVAEREMLLWQMGAALYSSNTISGASGDALDNLLALQGLSRKPAIATYTAPTPATQADGRTLYGFVLFGDVGTVIPAGALFSNGQADPLVFSLNSQVTIGPSSNARQTLIFSGVATGGTYSLTLGDTAGATYTLDGLSYGLSPSATMLTFASGAAGSFTLTLDGQTTASLDAQATAVQVQAAINALDGYGSASVVAAAQGGFAVSFSGGATPTITAAGSAAPTVTDSLQAQVSGLSQGNVRPFTDVAVSANGSGYQFDFGALTPAANQPSTAGAAIPLLTVSNDSLVSGSKIINISILQPRTGSPARGLGAATCTKTGAYSASANSITTVATPQVGLTGCTNELDAITGQDVETDTQAVSRLVAQRSGLGSSSLAAALSAIRQLDGVTAALGFVNSTSAALQRLQWASSPGAGSFKLQCAAGTTSAIDWAASAGAVQLALSKLTGMGSVRCTGDLSGGLIIDFNGALGGQPQPLVSVVANSTGATLTARYDRPAHAIEVVVAGGEDDAIAAALLGSLPLGITAWGAPSETTTGSCTSGSQTLTVADATYVQPGQLVEMPGLTRGTKVATVSGNTLTVNASALTTQSGVDALFTSGSVLSDASGSPVTIKFTRPTQVLVKVVISLLTDTYLTPGDPSSGRNPSAKWAPEKAAAIQAKIVELGNSVPIGGTIVARGSNGLIGAFNFIEGVLDYSIAFGPGDAPTNTNNLTLTASQAPLFQLANVEVSFS